MLPLVTMISSAPSWPRAARFQELDVRRHQQADPDAVPQGGGVAVARRENAAVGGPTGGSLRYFRAMPSERSAGWCCNSGRRPPRRCRSPPKRYVSRATRCTALTVGPSSGSAGADDVVFAGEAGRVGFRNTTSSCPPHSRRCPPGRVPGCARCRHRDRRSGRVRLSSEFPCCSRRCSARALFVCRGRHSMLGVPRADNYVEG